MHAKVKVVIMPRWGGGPGNDWYPWISEVYAALGTAELEVLAPPDPGTPTIDAWVGHLRAALGDDPSTLARTVVVGHSVGCQAVLRWAASLPSDRRLGALLLVAGWWRVDEPWATLEPWTELDYELERVRTVAPRPQVMLGLDDPFTADYAANARLWEERLDARVFAVPGAKHFNDPRQVAVFEHIDDLVASVRVSARWSALDGLLGPAAGGANLRPGASEAALTGLERALGRRLPGDLRRSLAIHDGGELGEHTLLSTGAIAAASATLGQPGVVPFADSGVGTLTCVDLQPGPSGRWGQLVRVASEAVTPASPTPLRERRHRYADWLEER